MKQISRTKRVIKSTFIVSDTFGGNFGSFGRVSSSLYARLDVFQAHFGSFGRVSSQLSIVWTCFKLTFDRLDAFQDNF